MNNSLGRLLIFGLKYKIAETKADGTYGKSKMKSEDRSWIKGTDNFHHTIEVVQILKNLRVIHKIINKEEDNERT